MKIIGSWFIIGKKRLAPFHIQPCWDGGCFSFTCRKTGDMLEEGPKGFEAGMNARKYIGITKASKATATRDLQDLLEKGIFKVYGAGRNTSYQVNI